MELLFAASIYPSFPLFFLSMCVMEHLFFIIPLTKIKWVMAKLCICCFHSYQQGLRQPVYCRLPILSHYCYCLRGRILFVDKFDKWIFIEYHFNYSHRKFHNPWLVFWIKRSELELLGAAYIVPTKNVVQFAYFLLPQSCNDENRTQCTQYRCLQTPKTRLCY